MPETIKNTDTSILIVDPDHDTLQLQSIIIRASLNGGGTNTTILAQPDLPSKDNLKKINKTTPIELAVLTPHPTKHKENWQGLLDQLAHLSIPTIVAGDQLNPIFKAHDPNLRIQRPFWPDELTKTIASARTTAKIKNLSNRATQPTPPTSDPRTTRATQPAPLVPDLRTTAETQPTPPNGLGTKIAASAPPNSPEATPPSPVPPPQAPA